MDGDGDLDLAVGNYQQVNQLYLNEGNGIFTENFLKSEINESGSNAAAS